MKPKLEIDGSISFRIDPEATVTDGPVTVYFGPVKISDGTDFCDNPLPSKLEILGKRFGLTFPTYPKRHKQAP